MTEKMLKFVHLEQKYPHKREASARRTDFNEIYEPFEDSSAADQSSRCSQCGVPFCQAHCPLYNNIPDWLSLTTAGRLEEAYAISAATNNMPEVTGRICPQDRLCEGNCVIEQSTHGAVTIGSVEKYITDTAFANGWVKAPKPTKENGMSVGIIGGGPGGMAAAEQLRLKGYEVHIYDRYDRIGGLLVYGIPGFKLEKDVVERRVKLLEEGGVVMHTEFEVGRDATLDDLRKKHDSVLIATGVYKARDLKLPGAGLNNVYPALEYLTTSNRQGLGDNVPAYDDGTLNAKDKNVVVIGGGDTAMDCVRTAIRQGAKSVKCLYRRDRANMPGSQREVANAEEEGVEFVWLTNPEAFVGDDKVTGVRAIKMRLGAPDAGGRQSPEIIEGSSYTMDADMAITALGFEPEDLPTLFDAPELGVSRWGTVKIDFRSMMTNLDGVFAAGDIARGASLVVWAIRDGRDAADRIDEYLLARKEAAA
ncbi:MAG: NAD(P)-dependent oxidoreductase [Thalassospira sp.]|uniref:NAD(P)-dependent oxidoreductase n=1 Tax=Thalassospira sp. TaxID=1912094 RepID=UPI0032EF4692